VAVERQLNKRTKQIREPYVVGWGVAISDTSNRLLDLGLFDFNSDFRAFTDQDKTPALTQQLADTIPDARKGNLV
jgi:hypothetical protein